MKNKFRLFFISLLVLVGLFCSVVPVYAIAISNPNTIRFHGANTPGYDRAKAFYNVNETGDMFFLAESYVYFAGGNPTDYSCQQAFSFELLNTTKTSVLLSTPVTNYGCKIVAIYQTATQVTALGLVSGTQYYLRLTMNPVVMMAVPTTPIENTNYVDFPLSSDHWIDQSVGKGTVNDLLVSYVVSDKLGMGSLASDLQLNDAVTTYIITIQGVSYLTTLGANIFSTACPNLRNYAPNAFQTTSTINTSVDPNSENGLAVATKTDGSTGGNINITSKLGPNLGGAFTNLGHWLGGSTMPQWQAGLIGLFIIMFIICIALAKVTGHPVVPVALGSMTLIIGGFLGLMPMALAFALTMLIFILAVWFFFSRGSV